jgi:hypothetical protein
LNTGWRARVHYGESFETERSIEMAEEARENTNNEWHGSPLQMWSGMDPSGIEEIAIQFATGDEEVLKPRIRDEFYSYELSQAAAYLEVISHRLP